MRKIIAFFCTGLFVLNITARAQSTDLTTLIDQCSPAIFKITTYDASGNEYAVGTGFFISSTGTALSNYHVFQGAAKARIKTSDNKIYLIDNVLAWSKETDMLKFTVKNELNEQFPYLKMNPVSPKQGERIFIIGTPLGLERSVADGIVSNIAQNDKTGETIQITAPISHGNSGSPLMNMNGEVLGIVAYYLENGQNLNFAVSIKDLNILDPINALKFPPEEESSGSVGTKSSATPDNSNSNTNPTNNSADPKSLQYYSDSKIKFCTDINADQPVGVNDVFFIDKDNGSYIYIWLGNNGKALATDEIIVNIYKAKRKTGELIGSEKYNVTPGLPSTYFKHIFTKAGDYVFKVYNKDNVAIQDGYVTIKYGK